MSLGQPRELHIRGNPAFTARYFEDTRTHDGREIKPLLEPSRFW